MSGKFSNIGINTNRGNSQTDPLEIFESLTLRGQIENIWTTQTEALKDWHHNREISDHLIQMNTGGGKTLVGLLIAKSLCNELQGKVLYVCPTNQLVEQTHHQAGQCGIETATYKASQWHGRPIYDEARGPCITNYAAVFNGRSKFFNEDIAGIVFDDSHVAYSAIRNAYTITIPPTHDLFKRISNLFVRYFLRSQSQRFRGVQRGVSRDVLIVPNFELRKSSHQVQRILYDGGIEQDSNNKFPWKHLQNNIGDCVLAISDRGLEISPAVVPVTSLPYFSGNCRRVYLTATAPSGSEFYRTFGGIRPNVISPSGKSGDAQRLIAFLIDSTEDNRNECLRLTEERKAAILVPSKYHAESWTEFGETFETEHGQKQIAQFSSTDEPQKLILIARFDGIDLPGKACRILILDGIPAGTSLLDRFATEMLRSDALSSAHVAVRIIQGMGRIFRSNTDHGVVLVPDEELERWFRAPRNRGLLPELVQRQVMFGLELKDAVQRGETTWTELITALLEGDKDWDKFYEQHIERFSTAEVRRENSWLDETVTGEHEAYQSLWNGDGTSAARKYEELANQCETADSGLAAWLWHWGGSSWLSVDHETNAVRCFIRAANLRSALGRPRQTPAEILESDSAPTPSAQASAIASGIDQYGRKSFSKLGSAEKWIRYGPDTKKAEEGLRLVGELLGLESTRPDTDSGDSQKTGPDVLWRYRDSEEGAAFECKTGKSKTGHYQKKDDIGQFHDHVAYLSDTYPNESFRLFILGRILPVSPESHPHKELRVVPAEDIMGLIRRISDMYENVLNSPTSEVREVQVERWLHVLGLSWPLCVDNLQYSLATDLQKGPGE